MKKQKTVRKCILAAAMVVLCNPMGWAQSDKVKRTETNTVATAKESPMSSTEELRTYHSTTGANDLRYSLLQAKSRLETGQADKSLTPQQISDLKAKIASIEGRMNAKEKPAVAPVDAVRSMRVSKQTSRAQFLTLTEAQQRDVLANIKDLNITDLVNASSVPKTRAENVSYITEDNFRNSDIMKQIYVLKNPSNYKIVSNGTVMPKGQITKAQLNSMPAERQKAILESNQYEITN